MGDIQEEFNNYKTGYFTSYITANKPLINKYKDQMHLVAQAQNNTKKTKYLVNLNGR